MISCRISSGRVERVAGDMDRMEIGNGGAADMQSREWNVG